MIAHNDIKSRHTEKLNTAALSASLPYLFKMTTIESFHSNAAYVVLTSQNRFEPNKSNPKGTRMIADSS